MQEDHVSMGWSAARKLRRSVDGLSRVVAIELMTAARALLLRTTTGPTEGTTPAPATDAVVRLLLEHGVGAPGPDRFLSPEIETAVGLVSSGAVLSAVEELIGELS
jgi:histidine ammonia-lyase